MTKRRLLIDGDILLYKIATQAEQPTDWGDGLWTLHADFNIATTEVDEAIQKLLDNLQADFYTMALSSHSNFRKKILPTYKANRIEKRKPILLSALRGYVLQNHNGLVWEHLEADDVCGILSTTNSKEEKIIVSIDKDLKQIPGLLSVDGKDVSVVSRASADYAFMKQTLTGDAVDGYTGVPGIGEKTAEKILRDLHGESFPVLLDAVFEQYEKANLSVCEFITQARVARILRAEDYNKRTKQIKLWGKNHLLNYNLYNGECWSEGAYI